jgi:hypothetical protein
MNIYQKIAQARVKFQSLGVRMSGENKFAGYQYFELSDILPVINNIGIELGFLCEVSFRPDIAVLRIRDTDKPEDVIEFASPMSTAALKGCHEVQNLGAVETYIKRYLYQNAFEIVECDSLNMTQGKIEPENKKKTDIIGSTPENLKRAGELTVELGIAKDEKASILSSCGNDVSKYIARLEDMKAKRNAPDAAFGTTEKQVAELFGGSE